MPYCKPYGIRIICRQRPVRVGVSIQYAKAWVPEAVESGEQNRRTCTNGIAVTTVVTFSFPDLFVIATPSYTYVVMLV